MTKKPKGKWLTDGDLQHDLALEMACIDLLTGRLTNVFFPTEKIRDDMKAVGGGLVVDPELTEFLWHAYRRHTIAKGKPPGFISGGSIHPMHHFIPITGSTHTWVGEVKVERPVQVLVFFAVPRRFAFRTGGKNGRDKARIS